jgi:4-hydroxythreonine-4-phosphate dehydrogenase
MARAVGAANRLALALGASASPVLIGVCGLNPHAGEGGLLGREEVEVLTPILDELRREYPGVSDCQPADTIFWRHLQGEFDVLVALYHDQGLAPLKAVEFDRAVNITMGLPWIRTSPDHGTGFDIAGRGIAGHGSFEHAVALADRIG